MCPKDDVSDARFTNCDPQNICRVQNQITGDTITMSITITAVVEAASLGFTGTGDELFPSQTNKALLVGPS